MRDNYERLLRDLQNMPLLATNVDRPVLWELAKHARHTKTYADTEVILQEDDSISDDSEMFFIVEGRVKFRIKGQFVGSAGAGDLFGEMGIIQNRRRAAVVTSDHEGTVLITVSKKHFDQHLRSSKTLMHVLTQRMQRRVQVAE